MTSAPSSPFAQRLLRIPPAYYVFGALLLTLWLARPQLFNPNVMGIFIRQVAPLGILVLGQLLVMRVRSIDLSGAGVILLVNYAPAGTPALLTVVTIALATMYGSAFDAGRRSSSQPFQPASTVPIGIRIEAPRSETP